MFATFCHFLSNLTHRFIVLIPWRRLEPAARDSELPVLVKLTWHTGSSEVFTAKLAFNMAVDTMIRLPGLAMFRQMTLDENISIQDLIDVLISCGDSPKLQVFR